MQCHHGPLYDLPAACLESRAVQHYYAANIVLLHELQLVNFELNVWREKNHSDSYFWKP